MREIIYLAGGCFWGMEKLMKSIEGVTDTTCGYANGVGGGDGTYINVCSAIPPFRETVKVEYDQDIVCLDTLLLAFFYVIDPEAVNRQGNDRGTKYQAGIYYSSGESKKNVERIVAMEKSRYNTFAVEVKELKSFRTAEEYHQDYLDKNPDGYCHISLEEIESIKNRRVDPGKYSRPDEKSIQELLTSEQYRITQNSGTEPAFNNAFWNHKEKGIYVDVVSGEPLFASGDKYESNCGWPAFSKPIDAFSMFERTDRDFGMVRTEVRSRAGNSHLGHVFGEDNESPTGIRYCINSGALRFIPFEKMEEEGLGDLKHIIVED